MGDTGKATVLEGKVGTADVKMVVDGQRYYRGYFYPDGGFIGAPRRFGPHRVAGWRSPNGQIYNFDGTLSPSKDPVEFLLANTEQVVLYNEL